ncbi:MAG: rhomboid family intramembrane serine protease [Simkania sp.]|nr:rhomboid family intramembrane serine protease [Simkania sp.]
MRFLNRFEDERKAYACTNFLQDQGIEAIYEESFQGTQHSYSVWVINEEDFEKSKEAFAAFEALPLEALQQFEKPKNPVPPPKVVTRGKPPIRLQFERSLPATKGRHALTHMVIALCVLLFLWSSVEETRLVKEEGMVALQVGLTPLQRNLLFDFPQCFVTIQNLLHEYPLKSLKEVPSLPADVQAQFIAIEHCPYWKGIFDISFDRIQSRQASYTAAPLFEKIRQGELWRAFTPCLLHRDFLHILFNMSWVLILGRMIEERTGKWRMTLLMVIIGIVSNVAQYLMSGPYFLGFSGIVCGMVGFIWMRQRLSPWEGYPLSNSTILFLVLFVLAMGLLQMVSLGLQLFGIEGIVSNIANTAHIIGGLTGVFLARIPLFSRSPT